MNLLVGFLLCAVFSVRSSPVSQPVYQNNQYLNAQQIPALQFKPQAQTQAQAQAQAQSYLALQPHLLAAARQNRPPAYDGGREGLQNYATAKQQQEQQQVQQPIQQVLLTSNVDRQVQRAAQYTSPLYLQQVQAAQQNGLAQQAIAAAQRKLTSQTLSRQIQPLPITVPAPQQTQYVPQTAAPQLKYAVQQAAPQVKYSRPIAVQPTPVQYRQPQEQPQIQRQEQQQIPEDYDPNPSYQFGFDVKDDLYTNYQNRKEQREGNKITGSYSVVDSDGFVRTVTYTADPKEGFKAEVTRQPTDIVVKIPKPEPQFQKQQYIQEVPERRPQYQAQPQPQIQAQPQKQNVIYQYQ